MEQSVVCRLVGTIKLDWRSLNKVQMEPAPPTNTLQYVLQRHGDIFKKELGTVRGVYAKLYVDLNAQPRFTSEQARSRAVHH